VSELPHGLVIDGQATFRQLGGQATQGKVPFLDPFQKPGAVFAPDQWLTVPVSRNRATQLMAVLTPTLKCAAA